MYCVYGITMTFFSLLQCTVYYNVVVFSVSALGFDELRFSVEPADAVVPKGGPALLHCSVVRSQGEPPAQVTWKHDGVNINFDAEGGRR